MKTTSVGPLRVISLGASYTGSYLAGHFPEEASVSFLTRDPARARRAGLRPLDPGEVADVAVDPKAVVLDTVPAVLDRSGAIDLPYRAILGNHVGREGGPRYIHLSSTSVYPSNFQAETEEGLPTLDEGSSPGPESARSKYRLLLEQAVLEKYPEASVLRCGGIYGPGRCVATRFRSGDLARASAGNRLVSRIHVHDLCRLIIAVARTHEAPKIVNAVDEQPSSNRETFAHLEEVLGLTVPGSWRNESPRGRRVKSKYTRGLLGTYRFPTFREGFADCLSRSPIT